MAAGTSDENIELHPVQCIVSSPRSETEDDDDVDCLPSEAAAALPGQTPR